MVLHAKIRFVNLCNKKKNGKEKKYPLVIDIVIFFHWNGCNV